jgi:hypothetical protein
MTSTSPAETVNFREIARERWHLNLACDDAREAETAFRLSLQEVQLKLLSDPTNSTLEAEHELGRERLGESIALREASERALSEHNRIHPTDAQIAAGLASGLAAEELREEQLKQAALREAFLANRQQLLEQLEPLRALEEEGIRLREEAMREYPVAAPGLARWADVEEAFTPFPNNFWRVPGSPWPGGLLHDVKGRLEDWDRRCKIGYAPKVEPTQGAAISDIERAQQASAAENQKRVADYYAAHPREEAANGPRTTFHGFNTPGERQ